MHDDARPPESEAATEEIRFVGLARTLGFLEEGAASVLLASSTQRHTPPSQVALQSGVLNVTQIDVVETLLHPLEVIPGYEILDFVGQGGMGVVYRARQKTLQRIVALKSVLVSQLASPGAAARFEQEAVTVARLQHPHIVAAYDFGRHAGRLFFVMEFVEGEDVERRIEREARLDEPTAWGLARQAASGLAHAAKSGIVHRDVKPANLLLVDPPAGFPLPPGLPLVKIADFGLAFLVEEAEARTRLTAANTALGSPHYMAPEQMERGQVDHRADVYSLGATVYHMLSGEAPFAGGTLTQILAEKLTRGPKSIRSLAPQLSEASVELIEAMMARDPAARPGDYNELIARIDGVLAGLGRRGPLPAALHSNRRPAEAVSDRTPPHELPTTAIDRIAASASSSVRTAAAASASLDQTQVLERVAEPRPVRRVPSWKAVLAIALGVMVLALGSSFLQGRGRSAPDVLEMTGRGEPLFDGITLKGGWRPTAGTWKVDHDEDDAGVISGKDGRIERLLRLHGWADDHAPMFRITLFVQPLEAETVDVQFALPGATDAAKNYQRAVLRLSRGTAVLGNQSNDASELRAESTPVTLGKTATGAHVVRIERHETRWWVWVDDRLLGGATVTPEERPAFALQVAGGTAWFSDVHLEELQQAQ